MPTRDLCIRTLISPQDPESREKRLKLAEEHFLQLQHFSLDWRGGRRQDEAVS
jgi:hypothetical protein